MNKRPLPLLVFLVLLALTGQLLAAPFMACLQAAGMSPDEHTHEMECCPMHAAGETRHMGPEIASFATVDDCEQHCFQCPALTPRQTVSEQLPPIKLVRAFAASIPLSRLDGLFRPPISA